MARSVSTVHAVDELARDSTVTLAGRGAPNRTTSILDDPPNVMTDGVARTSRDVGASGITVHEPRGAGRLPARSVTFPIVTMYVAPGCRAEEGTNAPVRLASS